MGGQGHSQPQKWSLDDWLLFPTFSGCFVLKEFN